MDIQSLSPANVLHVTNGNDLKLVSFNRSQRVYFKRRMRFGEAAVFFSGLTPHRLSSKALHSTIFFVLKKSLLNKNSSTSLPGEACLLNQTLCDNAAADPDVLYLLKNVSSKAWKRHSMEMRCLVLVFPERLVLSFVVAVAILCVAVLRK